VDERYHELLLRKDGHFCNRPHAETFDLFNVRRVKFSEIASETVAAQAQLKSLLLRNRKSQKSICYNGLTRIENARAV